VTAALIDLDAVPRAAATRRPLSPLLASLVLVLLLGAAVPAPRAAPTVIIPATFRDDTFVDGDRLFVVGPFSGAGVQLLRIFRLPDAQPLGQMEIGYPGSISGVRRVGDVLLITAGGPRVTVAVDARSGRQLWETAANVVSVSGDTVLMSDDLAIFAMDARGKVLWRVDWPSLGPRYLVSAGLNSMTSYDGRTGASLASARIHLSGIVYTYISADRFVIGDSSGLSAYRLPSLALQWHVPTDPQENRLQPDCVRVLCSYVGRQGVTVRDPATGRTVWTNSRWAAVEPIGADLVGAADHGTLDAVRLYLLDPATGEPRGDFGGWRAVIGTDGTLRYALHPASSPDDYWFGEFDPAHGSVRILGEAPQVSGHTDVSAGSLIYHRIDGTIAVWRFG
jgi:putative pyrroloquinoline-quinone binding quinoprotein